MNETSFGCIRQRRCSFCFLFLQPSCGCLLSLVDRAVIEEVGVRVVAVDFEHFRDEATPGPALDLNDDMERVSDIAFNVAVLELDTALQRAAREPSETLFGRVRMNGGQCPRMTRVQKLTAAMAMPTPKRTPSNPRFPHPSPKQRPRPHTPNTTH